MFEIKSYPDALQCVLDWVGPNHPDVILAALADMVFDDCSKLEKLYVMKEALDKRDYITAAKEVDNTDYCSNVE